MTEEKRTPLYQWHDANGGKMVEYAGWQMPVQYEGLMSEHHAVRQKAGMFDVSHMGEVRVKGKEALSFIQHLLTNDFSSMKDGEILYTFMCYPEGGVVDDLLVYRFAQDEYLLVINAGNVQKDLDWINEKAQKFEVDVIDESDRTAELAIQGPLAEEITQRVTDQNLSEIKFFNFKDHVTIAGVKCLISRTGYTGEDGFEIYTKWDELETVWKALMKAGEDEGIQPAGLGCRDTLRFEAGLPLYGHEISKDISPVEAGYGFFVKLKKDDFIGLEALKKQKEAGIPRKLVGFEMLGKGIPRSEYDVLLEGEKIGFVTTGYVSPTLNKNVGLALVDRKTIEGQEQITIQIRKKQVEAKLIPTPFYRKNTKSKG
ncbi:glycine cleavage system aminomethyltransferase GcvT [Tindallia californiensis]|uniref:Aminomethyltransferase n=1 Tax=Tindallia californiensis TaxID=159292 RepID=A0A1H3MQW6_9FIRM|nr:glycine cleavage system aminomethyltransferase GcvT [Tindallia californiensis]SDY78828.1 aminomethyltransferase [Tindallia californiensis]